MNNQPIKPIKLVKTRPEQVNLIEEAVVPIQEVLVGVETGKIYIDPWRQRSMGLCRRLYRMQRRLLQS